MPLFDLSTDDGATAYRAFLTERAERMRRDDFETLEGIKAKVRDLDYAIVGDSLFVAEGYEDGVIGTMFAQMVDWLATADLVEGQRVETGDLYREAVAGLAAEPPRHAFLKTLFWLGGGWGGLLDTQFVYRDDAGDEFVVGREAVDMLDGKPFVHPATGVPDPDADAKTIVCFTPSAKLLALRSGPAAAPHP